MRLDGINLGNCRGSRCNSLLELAKWMCLQCTFHNSNFSASTASMCICLCLSVLGLDRNVCWCEKYYFRRWARNFSCPSHWGRPLLTREPVNSPDPDLHLIPGNGDCRQAVMPDSIKIPKLKNPSSRRIRGPCGFNPSCPGHFPELPALRN